MRFWMLKRAIDLLIALPAVMFLLPLWGMIGALIYLEDPGPIFFRQKRVGRDGDLFSIIKFRSMILNDVPPLALGAVKHDHALVTRVGYWLRRTKLDETPQFLSVILGKMSLVGPRPCLVQRLPTMTTFERARFLVLPGLSGWAEVNGNVELSWEEQVALDVWYVHHWTIWLDLKIIFLTFKTVFFGSIRNEAVILAAKRFIPNEKETACAY